MECLLNVKRIGVVEMKKWFQKTGVTLLLAFSLFVGLTDNVDAVVQAKAETSEQSVTVKIGTKKLNKKTYTMEKGSSKKIRLLVTPKKFKVKAKYHSSKEGVVSVSKTGVLKAKRAGTAKIIVKVSGEGNFQEKLWFKVKVVNKSNSDEESEVPVTLTVGGKTFAAKFYDNQTTRELVKKMPMTLSMKELNGNEKYYYLNTQLPMEETSPKTIQAGEIKLYGSDCLVVFYKTHTTSYEYTSVGYVEDVPEFVKAVGDENVEITFQQR